MRLLPFDHAVRNLGRSPRRLALVVGGSALVSLLVLAAVAFSRGLDASLSASGLATNAMLIGSGSEESAERSEIPPSVAGVLAASVDGLALHAGSPAVAAEIVSALPALRPDGAQDAEQAPPVLVRGYDAASFTVHPQVRLREGRWPRSGADEVSAGAEALARIGGAEPGDAIELAGRRFTVVGVHEARGTAMHGEVWMRVELLAELTQRTTRSCVVAALGSAEFDDIDAFAASRLDLETVAMRESDYYARLAELFGPIRLLVAVTALLVATGGVLGGVNAMYAAFATRVREAGTLQALGFSRVAIALSLVIESTVACAAGALLAAGAGLVLLDGTAVRFSMGSFGLSVDGVAVAAALGAGIGLGLLGALPAIVRCLSIPLPEALRA